VFVSLIFTISTPDGGGVTCDIGIAVGSTPQAVTEKSINTTKMALGIFKSTDDIYIPPN
jgi:hypothetical protein